MEIKYTADIVRIDVLHQRLRQMGLKLILAKLTSKDCCNFSIYHPDEEKAIYTHTDIDCVESFLFGMDRLKK